MTKSPSTVLYEFLQSLVDAAPAGSILFGAEVLDSRWQEITSDKGLVVSNAEWEATPGDPMQQKVFADALLIIGFYRRISSNDTSERRATRDECFAMSATVASAIYNDMSLGNRVCDALLLRAVDGDKSDTSDSYSIINQPIILNPSGSRIDFNLGEAQ